MAENISEHQTNEREEKEEDTSNAVTKLLEAALTP